MGKKRLRDMTWDDYGLSRDRRRELRAFCLQYDKKRAESGTHLYRTGKV